MPAGWVSLDADDNNPVRFLSYLVAALETVESDLGGNASILLQNPEPIPIQNILTALLNDISAYAHDFVLALDDYHLIENPAIHQSLWYIIEHMPATMHLALLTRADPSLPLPRLRAQGQLMEIRAEHLRFTRSEIAAYLQQVMVLALSTEQIESLETRSEGWIAGLQLAALSMQGREPANLSRFISDFTGGHHYIVDYLVEEVLNRQPNPKQEFLLQTSILERLSGALCDALTGRRDGQKLLEGFENDNLFLTALDDERYWYRYHRLFADVLRNRLEREHRDMIPALHQLASEWFEREGYSNEAWKHAISAHDLARAARIVENNAMHMLQQGNLTTLLEWMAPLETLVPERPWLGIYQAWALLLTGQFEPLERLLEGSERLLNPGAGTLSGEQRQMSGHICAIRAYSAAMQQQTQIAIDLATQALGLLSEQDYPVRCVVTFVLGGIHFMRKDLALAMEAMKAASWDGERAGNIHLAISALNALGNLLHMQGDLAEAERTYERALKLGTGSGGRPLPITASIHSALAEMYLSRNNLEHARQLATTSVALARQWGNPDSLTGSYLALAHVAHIEGDSAEAQQALDEAKHLAATHRLTPGFEERIAAYEALIYKGRPDRTIRGYLIEALTDRELEVLNRLAKGASNPEIAAELVIALGTVKAHTSSIYRKLDVRGRTEAVIRAGELGLL